MGGPTNTPKLFGLFTLLVICLLLLVNLYQISADSKVDTDLVFDSHERSKHDNHLRIQRNLEQIEIKSSPPVEEHWLTSTVNRIKRSINSIFSPKNQEDKLGRHVAHHKPKHRKQSNKSKLGRSHRQAEYNDENEEEYDEEQNQLGEGETTAQPGENETGQEEDQDEDEPAPDENNENQSSKDDYDDFSPIQIGEGQEEGQEEGQNGQENENGEEGGNGQEGQIDFNTDNENGNNGNFVDENNANHNPDDEDSNNGFISGHGDFGSGEGEETTPRPDYSHPRIYRFAFTVMEPYREDYRDRNSPNFQQLAERIKRSLDDVFSRIPGQQYVSVISLERSKLQDPFKVRVTADIDSEGYSNSEEIKRAVYEPVNNKHRIGDLTTTDPEDLRFTEFGATQQKCNENELQCKSGQCVSASSRCDRNRDCNDNSDEEGCAFPEPVEPDIPDIITTTTTTEQTTTEERTIPPTPTTTKQPEIPTITTTNRPLRITTTPPVTTAQPFEGSGAGDCRADDSVRCSDGSRSICADQVCDSIADCDDGGDERDCGVVPVNECRIGEFKCDVYRCIPVNQRCDGVDQCTDRTDEHNCKKECNNDEFTCDEQCLPNSRKCDGIRDCMDNTDEADCQEQQCQSGEFSCGRGDRCIPNYAVCNGIRECRSGADEANCSSVVCRQDQFRCGNGKCIPKSQLCDRQYNCEDLSDERNCPCLPDDFQCGNGFCIPHSQRCDEIHQCQDGTDEIGCNQTTCERYQWRCKDGTCIDQIYRCNKQKNCPDNSDEIGCNHCEHDQFRCSDGTCLNLNKVCDRVPDCPHSEDEESCGSCKPNEFTCTNGQCVPEKYRCNNADDCSDRSDELNCVNGNGRNLTCQPNTWKCRDGLRCVKMSKVCDGINDCQDSSDESQCDEGSQAAYTPEIEVQKAGPRCQPDEFECREGYCIEAYKQCNGYRDCPSGSDEENCQPTTTSPPFPECASDQFDCGDKCIDIGYRCDGVGDCNDGRDESGCGNCREDEFQCETDQQCISADRKCDGNSDCSDNSDEFDCPTQQRCSSNQFTCDDRSCIDDYRQCDGRRDCPDGSDEAGCPSCASGTFQCIENFECIPLSYQCNGRNDCKDGSDEYNCLPETTTTLSPETTRTPPISCRNGYQPCRSRDQCVRLEQLCDGRADCNDFSDESNCRTSKEGLDLRTYPTATEEKERQEVVLTCRDEGPIRARVHWERANGGPLPFNSTDIRGRLTMPNIQMEHTGSYLCIATDYPSNTPGARVSVPLTVVRRPPRPTPLPPTVCGVYEATCSNGECIPRSKLRDGKFDCSDGSDEDGYRPNGCEPNEYQCANKKCVLKTWRCDSQDDCGDGSDEDNCATNPPFSVCQYHQFACRSNNQCIPKSYHCDVESDCVDGSDEVGCSKPVISRPPPPIVTLNVGETFEISCTAVGIPTPEIVWRLNWGHVPSKCRQTSVNGVGTLVCENIQVEDQGAYSCESLSIKGSTFAVPDTILSVKHENPCRPGYFNVQARSEGECIKCFCFGHTSSCRSADLFTFQFQPPFDTFKVLGVRIDPSGAVDVRDEPVYSGSDPLLSPNGPQGVYATIPGNAQLSQPNVIPYFAMPENYHGNQLKSYGGYMNYFIKHTNRGAPLQGPNIIISGNGYTLLHQSTHSPAPNTNENIRVRFFEGEWIIRAVGSRERPATREEIMMVLEDINNILIKLQYNDGQLNTTISNVEMESAGLSNVGLGPATYVEECTCPVGYSGTSCERCSDGYVRQRNGPWLGLCVKEPKNCPRGMYNDGRECQICPCPLTDASNQFGRTCQQGPDGDVICNCPAGYVGNRCQFCAEGYEGSPLTPGDSCRPIRPQPSYCDASGSTDPRPDQFGRCRCKNLVDGRTCNQCKANTFHLSSENQFGCVSCFCMGVSQQCSSSNWYRDQVSSIFTSSTQDFKIVSNLNRDSPISAGITLDQNSRQISYSSFITPEVYYWDLPSRYLGNKLTAYGGYLRYLIRHTAIPGGQSSRNNAADVELVSKNNINLLFYNKNQTQTSGGAQSFAVPIFEQYWQRTDGQVADREHLLMVLADLEKIYIKATYFTKTEQTSLISVSLDTASERNTGSLQRALEVEQCHCPVGYTGLSCENCDVGYTRTPNGLYLGLCEACSCNGFSNDCDPDSGLCVNCKNGTTGDYCDECLEGYTGDPANGIPCTIRGPPPPCNCDPRGSTSTQCVDGRCRCKINVEGDNCDRCRPGSFGLNSSSVDGCEFCFCSGVASECTESNLYVEQIPYQITEVNNGFSVTDQSLNTRINDNFDVNELLNEISYGILPSNRETLYWSLPGIFTGNKIKSYGGKLEFSQRYTQRPQARYVPDKDIIIIGNGITIFWTNSNEQRESIVNLVSATLHPTAGWLRLDQNQGPRPASREDILTALANIEAILIRATQSSDTIRAYLSDITLDTAVEQYTSQPKAGSVEVCRCPQGYEGSSCESCDAGYYRDRYFDQSRPLGSCSRCPCNDREESCELGPDRRVVCHCKPEWTGRTCEFEAGYPITTTEYPDTTTISQEPTIEVTIEDTNIGIYEVGSTVRYNCSARSRITPGRVRVFWRKADGDLPSHAIDDGSGLLVITNLKVSDSGRYVCEASDGYTIVTSSVNLNVGVPRDQKPRIALSQTYIEVNEGQQAEIQCVGSGVPTPEMSVVRADGQPLSPDQRFENGVFIIYQSQISDSGEYVCLARNRVGTDQARFTIVVHETAVGPIIRVEITPPSFTGVVGDTVVLRCSSFPYGQIIRWSKQGGELPYNSREDRGTLIIRDASPDVSGVYVCTITSSSGTSGSNRASVTITGGDDNGFPTAQVSTERVTLNQGGSIEIQCTTTGNPPPSVKWTKLGADLSSNTEQFGSTLNIRGARIEDRGVYVCVATNIRGIAQASVVVEVTRLETPRLEIYPQSSQIVISGNSAVVQCRAVAGIPSPVISWTRENNLPLSQNVEEMSGGTLRFTSITPAEQGEYVCTATNEAGRATATANIIVQTPPDIIITPRQEVITKGIGSYLRLECEGIGTPQPSVAWSKYGQGTRYLGPPLSVDRPNIAYQEFTHLTRDDEGTYICRAESSAGIVERRVQLVVDTLPSRGDITGEDATSTGERPGYKDNEPTRPHYTTTFRPEQPTREQEYIAALGGRAEIRCSIENRDGSNIQVRWSRTDGTQLPSNAFERNGILYIDNVEPEAQGEYSCTGYDQTGAPVFNLNAYLTVISPPRITLIPPRQIVHPGEHAYINCSATGEQPIEISWSPIERDLPRSVYTRDGYIRFNNIQLEDAGRYLCTANNRAGSAEAVADVIVEENVSRPAIRAEQKQQQAPIGTTVTLRCRANSPSSGNSIRWFRERLELPAGAQQNGEVLYLRNVQPEDQGRYYCEIQTREGTYSDYVDLQLTGPYPTTTQRPYLPQSQPTLYISPPEADHYSGENVEIYCQSSERGAIPVWSKISGSLSSNVESVGGTLRIVDLITENAGVYRCEATGRQGVQFKDYTLNVIDDQYKDEPPLQIKEAQRGSTVVLECKADFESTQYVWRKQGAQLPKYVDEFAQSIQLNDIDGSDAGAYTCTASNGIKSVDVPLILVVTGIVPYFTQAPNSYITLPTLGDSYMQFNFEISFKPQQDSGLILYNGNKGNDVSGDFISLSLVDSVPEFKYNLGMGTTTVKSERPIAIGDWHTIKISRNRRKVTMYVDGDGPFIAVSEGRYTGLDLTEPMYLGGVPSSNGISPDVSGYTPYQGFVGCISRFKIGHAHLDILREALNKTGITTCETCSDNKCQNQGACQEALSKEGYMCICPSGFSGPTCNKLRGEACSPHACGEVGRCIDTENGFECQCPLGRAGRRCEREITVIEPAFQNDAYIAYPTPKPARKLKLTLKIKPNSLEDGILLYCSESEEGFGNFISLAIKDKHLEFRFDAGSGVTTIRDESDLRPGEWHIVTATRSLSEGRVMIDGQAPAVGRSPGNYKTINLQTPLFIGGFDKQHIRVSSGVQVFSGFNGCIADINLANTDIHLIQNITDSANVRDCSEGTEDEDNNIFNDNTDGPYTPVSCLDNPCQNNGHCYPLSPTEYQCACAPGFIGKNCETSENICDPNPCQNQGVCRLTTSRYACDCPLGFTGRSCDQVTELRSDANFNGDGYLEFSKNFLGNSDQDVIALELSTNQSNGLIFWHGQTPDVDGQGQDYIALAIQDGYLEYSFDLGNGPAVIQNRKIRLDDGQRHLVILKRNLRKGSIEIDNAWLEEGESEGQTTTLDTEGNIYIGGLPNISKMTGNKFTQSFNGCIHGFELQNSQRLDLGFKAINGLNVKPCSSFTNRDIWSNDLVN